MTKFLHGAPRRPNIAVVPDWTPSTPEAPYARYELRAAYPEAVLRAGGLPLIVAYSEDLACIDAWLDRSSGLLLTGGAFDVPPELYGEPPREGLGPLKPVRTAFEVAVLKSALGRRMPVLAVCGGMQLLNAALGGTLVQDLGRELPNARAHEQSHDRAQPQHPVEVKEHTLLADCVGKGQLMVNSTHHQAVKTLGTGLLASASAPDGVVEAIEVRDMPFVVGVQWHPELMLESIPVNLGLFRGLVAKARERRHSHTG
jgi:putative glutamine amidotransferase